MVEARARDLAIFNLAIESRLPAVTWWPKVEDVAPIRGNVWRRCWQPKLENKWSQQDCFSAKRAYIEGIHDN